MDALLDWEPAEATKRTDRDCERFTNSPTLDAQRSLSFCNARKDATLTIHEVYLIASRKPPTRTVPPNANIEYKRGYGLITRSSTTGPGKKRFASGKALPAGASERMQLWFFDVGGKELSGAHFAYACRRYYRWVRGRRQSSSRALCVGVFR
jgi:hypothetical protein